MAASTMARMSRQTGQLLMHRPQPLHVVLDGAGGTHLGAHAALALEELAAELRIDDGLLGDGLRKGDGDGRGGARQFVKGVGRLFGRAFFGAWACS